MTTFKILLLTVAIVFATGKKSNATQINDSSSGRISNCSKTNLSEYCRVVQRIQSELKCDEATAENLIENFYKLQLEFGIRLSSLADKDIPLKQRLALIESTKTDFFTSPNALVTVTTLRDGKPIPIRRTLNEYLNKLVHLKYTKVSIEFGDIMGFMDIKRVGALGTFDAAISVHQEFQGVHPEYSYSDVVEKKLRIAGFPQADGTWKLRILEIDVLDTMPREDFKNQTP